jgi:segregation and condensation protein B
MSPETLKPVLEAAIMAAREPLDLNTLLALFEGDAERPDRVTVRAALDLLQGDCAGRGVELVEVASGWRYQVRSRYADWVNRLFDEKPQRYSRALLETLAIIAYRQPITRAEIEDIRGVSVSTGIIRTLQEREWVRVVGNREVPGRPELLATTRQFLDYFNLKSLSDLPTLAEIKDFDRMNPDLFEGMDLPPACAGADGAAGADAADAEAGIGEPDDNVVPFVPASGD